MLDVTVRGLSKLKKDLKAEKKRAEKAEYMAVRVEAFRLRKQMIKEIKAGSPGGRQFQGLSYISRRVHDLGNRRLRPDKPLAAKIWGDDRGSRGKSLADMVRVYMPEKNKPEAHIGFVGPSISESWKRIAKKQQEGAVQTVSEEQRRLFAYFGGETSKRSIAREYLFLRGSTRTLRTPARPIIEPFIQSHRSESLRRIRDNFRRKMKGKRI